MSRTLVAVLLFALPAAAAPVPAATNEPDPAAVAAWKARGVEFEWHGTGPFGRTVGQPDRKGLADPVFVARLWAWPEKGLNGLPPLKFPHRIFAAGFLLPPDWAAEVPDRDAVVGFNFSLLHNPAGVDVEEVLKFPNVSFLRLQQHKIPAGLVGRLAGLKLLTSLGFCNSKLAKGELECLPKLKGLRELDLSWIDALADADMEALKGMDELKALDIHHTKVSDAGMGHLAGLKGLRSLRLEDTAVGNGGLEALAGLTALQQLNLHGCTVTGDGLAHLAGMTDLRELNLPSFVTDAAIAHIKGLGRLEHLDLSSARLTDTGVEVVTGFKRLRYLNCAGAQMADETVANLRRKLPGCRVWDGRRPPADGEE